MTEVGQTGDALPAAPAQYDLDLHWPSDIGAQAQVVNKALFAWDETQQDVVYMYLGHVAPPPWLTPEEAAERGKELGSKFPVEPQGSFIMSRRRAEELWEALGKHLGKLPK